MLTRWPGVVEDAVTPRGCAADRARLAALPRYDEPPMSADASEQDTPALRALAEAGIPHRVVRTVRAHTAEESAELQGIEPRQLFRTIVVRRGTGDYLFVLVPAGRRFDWPKLRAHLGVSRMSLPDADEARTVTGYERGTITPFGAARALPVIVDASVAELPLVAVGGGGHGVNIHLAPADLIAATAADVVDVTEPEAG
jgi:Cys-tRNA(Pro)/Cys-tRNA(Cys) deacylase